MRLFLYTLAVLLTVTLLQVWLDARMFQSVMIASAGILLVFVGVKLWRTGRKYWDSDRQITNLFL